MFLQLGCNLTDVELVCHLEVSVNDVLLVAVLHRRYDLQEDKKTSRSLVERLLLCSQAAIKDVVEGGGGGGGAVDADRNDQTQLKTPGGRDVLSHPPFR